MAPSLLQLPYELFANIFPSVPNSDLENFTLTCKRIHALATKPLQEHGSRQNDFGRIAYGYPKVKGEPSWVHPTLMLLDLFHDDLLYYPWS